MTTSRRLSASADGAGPDAAAVVAALSSRFQVDVHALQSVRRARLDTFDRRLAAAGLFLEHLHSRGGDQLVLHRPDAPPLRTDLAGPRWPALADALPQGPLRQEVADASDIRALMELSDERRRRRTMDLRDDQGKIVARVEVDVPVGPGSGGGDVTVTSLRGYDGAADSALRLLAELPGLVEHVDGPGRDSDPALDGPAATDSSGPLDEPVEAGTPATTLLAVVLRGFQHEMRRNVFGVVDDIDTEFLHDLRVAVRRTRSTLKIGRPVLAPTVRERWEPAFKTLGDLTTPVRDLDVHLLDLPTMAGWLVSARAEDLEPFAVHLRRHRGAEQRRLVRALRAPRFERLQTDWSAALDELRDAPQAAGHDPTASAAQLAGRSITRTFRHVARVGGSISADSPAEDLHTLRKRCKELRYALEIFAPVTEASARKAAISDLKSLQDVLGRFQDSEVQRHAIRAFAEEMWSAGTAPAGTLLAMGELAAHLEGEQARARAEFGGRFDRFVRPASRRRIDGLSAGGDW